MKPTRLIGLVVAMSVVATLSFAQSDPIQIVKKRQENMKSFSSTYMRGIFDLRKVVPATLAILPSRRRRRVALSRRYLRFSRWNRSRSFPGDPCQPRDLVQRGRIRNLRGQARSETTKLADFAASGKHEDTRAQSSVVIEACFSCHGGPSKSGGKFRSKPLRSRRDDRDCASGTAPSSSKA